MQTTTLQRRLLSFVTAIMLITGFMVIPNNNTQALTAGDITILWGTPYAVLDSNKPDTDGPLAMYIELEFTNPTGGTGTLYDVSATLSAFSNTAFTLDAGESATRYLGTLTEGQTIHQWWFVNYPFTIGATTTFTVTLSDSLAGTVVVGPYSLTTRSELSAMAGGKLISQTIGGPGYIAGQVIPMTVVYEFGNVGSNQDVVIQPAGNISHEGGCFRLIAVDVTDTPDNPVEDPDWSGISLADDNDLYFSGVSSTGSGNAVTVDYYFLYTCAGTSSTLQPFADMGSGTQYKYTGNFPYCSTGAACTLPAGANPFTITKTVTPDELTQAPGTSIVTYKVIIANSSTTSGSYINRIADLLPAGVIYKGLVEGNSCDPTITNQVTAAKSSVVPAMDATGAIEWIGNPVVNGPPIVGQYYIGPNTDGTGPLGNLALCYLASIPTDNPGAFTNHVAAYITEDATTPIGYAEDTVYIIGNSPALALIKQPLRRFMRL